MKYSALYQVSPATFHVISRKVDFLWDRLRRPQLKKHYTEAAAYTAWRFLGSLVSHKRFFYIGYSSIVIILRYERDYIFYNNSLKQQQKINTNLLKL